MLCFFFKWNNHNLGFTSFIPKPIYAFWLLQEELLLSEGHFWRLFCVQSSAVSSRLFPVRWWKLWENYFFLLHSFVQLSFGLLVKNWKAIVAISYKSHDHIVQPVNLSSLHYPSGIQNLSSFDTNSTGLDFWKNFTCCYIRNTW